MDTRCKSVKLYLVSFVCVPTSIITPVHLALFFIHIFIPVSVLCLFCCVVMLYLRPLCYPLPMHLHISHYKDHPMWDHALVLYKKVALDYLVHPILVLKNKTLSQSIHQAIFISPPTKNQSTKLGKLILLAWEYLGWCSFPCYTLQKHLGNFNHIFKLSQLHQCNQGV